jgi:hypothetical protein
VPVELVDAESGTQVVLTQDGNVTERARAHSEGPWGMTLTAMQTFLEGTATVSDVA